MFINKSGYQRRLPLHEPIEIEYIFMEGQAPVPVRSIGRCMHCVNRGGCHAEL
jgi:hypothetical protein